MILAGCLPRGRNTEQHDVFFGVGKEPGDLAPALYNFWPEAKENLHIDAWREVNYVNGFIIKVYKTADGKNPPADQSHRLFFINLGGYKRNEFDEFHYKMLTVAKDKSQAVQDAKETAFYKHTGFPGATSHIDDKFGVAVDDIYEIQDILIPDDKNRFKLGIKPAEKKVEDEIHLGYFMLDKL